MRGEESASRSREQRRREMGRGKLQMREERKLHHAVESRGGERREMWRGEMEMR